MTWKIERSHDVFIACWQSQGNCDTHIWCIIKWSKISVSSTVKMASLMQIIHTCKRRQQRFKVKWQSIEAENAEWRITNDRGIRKLFKFLATSNRNLPVTSIRQKQSAGVNVPPSPLFKRKLIFWTLLAFVVRKWRINE